MLLEEGMQPAQQGQPSTLSPAVDEEQDRLFILSDQMYMHHLLRINYTTYDVRRSQDIINPGTSHWDIMLLDSNADGANRSSTEHPFLYARVLGIYHVNVAYARTGMLDYVTRRLDFVWVRWYDYIGTDSLRWSDRRLDSVCFPPLDNEKACGFIGPQDILCGCHIIPAFVDGKVHRDLTSLSRSAKDVNDFKRYLIDRFALFKGSHSSRID